MIPVSYVKEIEFKLYGSSQQFSIRGKKEEKKKEGKCPRKEERRKNGTKKEANEG